LTISAPSLRPARLTHVARSTLIIAAFFAIDKGLGLLRQVIIGRQFGVSTELDAFNAANNLPDLLFAMISGGALSIAFIPVLSQHLQREGRPGLWEVFSRVANLAFLVTAGLAVLIAAFARPLVRAELGIAPGFHPEVQSLVADLMRLNLVATLIFSLSGLASSGLQANQHFLLPAMAPVLYDVGQIAGATVLAPSQAYHLAGIQLPALGLGVHGLVYGVILGAALHLGVQIPGLLRYRFRWAPRLDLHHPGVRQVIRMLGPRILTIGAFNVIFIVQDNLASRLDLGSVTALAYGWLIMQVPETLFGTAVGIALLPTLSEHFARSDDRAFFESLGRAARVLFALTVPCAALLAVCMRPLVEAAFQFDAYGTGLVVGAARAYLAGLIGHALLEVAARGFYARQNPVIPLIASVFSAAVFILCAILFFRPLGAAGIGLSNSLAFSLEAGILLVLLWRMYPALGEQKRVGRRSLAAAASSGLVGWACLTYLALDPMAVAAIGLALGSLAAAAWILPELRELIQL
jgi:putative peptidoglycan lipid II flippase